MTAMLKAGGAGRWRAALFVGPLLALGLLLPGTPATSQAQAAKPRVACANPKHEAFYYRRRPVRCNFHYENAFPFPIFSWNLMQTKRMNWHHWGAGSARGNGFFFARRPPWWREVRVRLTRPRKVCGSRAFTRIRLQVKQPRGWPRTWASKRGIVSCKPRRR